jgi:hypothetical protein
LQESENRKFRLRRKGTNQLEEAIEVVDNIDLEDEEEREPYKVERKKKGLFRFRKAKV